MTKSIDLRVAEKLVANRREDVRNAWNEGEREAARKRLADARQHLYEVIEREPGYEKSPVEFKK
jgi:hypothetical protein